MPVPTHPTKWSTHSASGDTRRRALYAGGLGATGVGLAASHVPHLVADVAEGVGVVALVTGAVFPFLLSVCIAAAGYWLWRSDVPVRGLRRVDAWFALGVVGMTVVSTSVGLYELQEGARLTHVRYVLLNFATAGGIGGIVAGYYDARTLQQREQLRVFRRIVEHGGHSIVVTRPDGTIEYVNPQFEAQTGYDRSEVVGENPRVLSSGEHDDAFYADLWETILDGDVWRGELVDERRDGTRFWVDQTIAPVTDETGEVEHFVAINRDVTDLKEYEAELERKNERLDEFASVVSHDLRSPLNVAAGRVALARDERDSEHLEEAARALERIDELVGDVLELARQGETIDETEPVPVRAVAEDAWRQVEAPDAGLDVRTDRVVSADRTRLQELFENLFRNAVEHGGRDVTVTVGDAEDGFFVADDGPGFSDADPDYLFESGYTTARDGTGLGLAIVQRIVEAHGADVSAVDGAEGARVEVTGLGVVERPADKRSAASGGPQ
ncbi:MAG: PAS domain S-box protein [Halobacterium sp.]